MDLLGDLLMLTRYGKVMSFVTNNKLLALLRDELIQFADIFNEKLDEDAVYNMLFELDTDLIHQALLEAKDSYIQRLDELETYVLLENTLNLLSKYNVANGVFGSWCMENFTASTLVHKQNLQPSETIDVQFRISDAALESYNHHLSECAAIEDELLNSSENTTTYQANSFQNFVAMLDSLKLLILNDDATQEQITQTVEFTSVTFSKAKRRTEKNFDFDTIEAMIVEQEAAIANIEEALQQPTARDMLKVIRSHFNCTNRDFIKARYSPPSNLKKNTIIRNTLFYIFHRCEDQILSVLDPVIDLFHLYESLTTTIVTCTSAHSNDKTDNNVAVNEFSDNVEELDSKLTFMDNQRVANAAENLGLNYQLLPQILESASKQVTKFFESGFRRDSQYHMILTKISNNLLALSKEIKAEIAKLETLRKSIGYGSSPVKTKSASGHHRRANSISVAPQSSFYSPGGSSEGTPTKRSPLPVRLRKRRSQTPQRPKSDRGPTLDPNSMNIFKN